MVCIKCQNEIKDDSLFCSHCGWKVEELSNTNEEFINEKDLKKRNQASDRVALTIIFLSIGLFIFLVVYGTNYITMASNSKILKFGSDEVSTLTSIVGDKRLVNIVDLTNYKEYKYSLSNIESEEISKYTDYLYDAGFVGYMEDDTVTGYIKESKDLGNVLKITIDVSSGYFVVSYTKEPGSVSDYKTDF